MSTFLEKRTSIFEAQDEAGNLLLGGVFLVFSIIFWTSGVKLEKFIPYSYLDILADLLFLNVIHIAFTFHLLLFNGEIKSWFSRQSSPEHSKMLLKWFFAGAVIFIFFSFRTSRFTHLFTPNGTLFIGGLLAAIQLHHAVKQWFGLSVLYNRAHERKHQFTASEETRLRLHEQTERLLFSGFLFTVCAPMLLNGRIHSDLGWRIACGAFAALIIGNSFCFPKMTFSNKPVFLLRLFLFATCPLSVLSPLGISALHGTEYLFIFRRMNRHAHNRNRRAAQISLFLLCIACVLLYLAGDVDSFKSYLMNYPGALQWISVFYFTFVLFHYYLDRQIFRMKDPLVRRYVGGALIAEH